MWHTSRGDRTLRGDEAALVSRAIEVMVAALLMHVDEDFEEDEAPDCESGIAIYDRCRPSQRLGLLHQVANHLLTETDGSLPLSALTDATVAAIFVEVRDQIAIEIGFAANQPTMGEPSWREMVLAAHRAVFPNRLDEDRLGEEEGLIDGPLLAVSEDLPAWEVMVNELCDSILWDRDFEMAESFLDVDPGVSRHRRRLLGIDDDYFTAVAPDPHLGEVLVLASRTRDIVRGKPR
jgi:hypothetical protein